MLSMTPDVLTKGVIMKSGHIMLSYSASPDSRDSTIERGQLGPKKALWTRVVDDSGERECQRSRM